MKEVDQLRQLKQLQNKNVRLHPANENMFVEIPV